MTKSYRYVRLPGSIAAALLIAVILSAAVVSTAGAATTVAWNATFSPENNSKFDAVAPTADGGYIALGSTLAGADGGREDLLLVKADGRGNEVWAGRFPGMAAASVAERPDGGYIAGAYNVSRDWTAEVSTYQGTSFLIWTDAAGEEIRRQVLPNEKVSAVRPTADGGYVVVGWLWNPPGAENDTTAIITKIDGDGAPVWNRTFPGTSANAGIVTADGGYVIGGTSSPFNNDIGDAFLLRLDADGNTLWHRNYQAPVVLDIAETGEGGFVYSGNYWYGLVDSQGEEVWLRNMEGLTGYAVALRPAGGYMIAGTDLRSGEAFAFGTDPEGTVRWNTTFPAAGAYTAESVPGGYVLAGVRYLSPTTSAAWLTGLEDAGEPTQAAPGFGAIVAGAALLLLLAGRKMRG
ncbi:SMP-30/gluconolactonase/LRE family protein [Methanoculleus sp. Wushi-C6]|uniref:SMP-30/gluconolactonase/LRE family protein n=1 Tax=Methanoculleus caldifontis TaxID=2651577 RepID=A0ABU3X0Q6_9EURY|nr:hypothetical protein [Methanoculleus sp. Wushi-C6]MDV2481612.1 SMP-30/gluconolactonase/LRE family protein [Methanoculleus sp. Wushi-C6]